MAQRRSDVGCIVFATLVAGLVISASTIVFTVVNTMLLRPLPFRKAPAGPLDAISIIDVFHRPSKP